LLCFGWNGFLAFFIFWYDKSPFMAWDNWIIRGFGGYFFGWVVPTASTIMFVSTTFALPQLSIGSSLPLSKKTIETD